MFPYLSLRIGVVTAARKMREIYAARRAILVELLQQELGTGWKYSRLRQACILCAGSHQKWMTSGYHNEQAHEDSKSCLFPGWRWGNCSEAVSCLAMPTRCATSLICEVER